MRIGFIGIGRMGVPMCRRLLAAGYTLIVHNRTRDARVEGLVTRGARAVDSPREVVKSDVDLVLACLPTVEVSESVFLGDDGLVAHAAAGQILVDHSTVGPAVSHRVAAAAAARGIGFLDAPVSGGPEGAAAGTLTIMAGGDASAFERSEPVLGVLGSTVRYLGPAGAGSVAKLVNQHLCFVHAVAAAEAMVFAVRAGADPAALLEILRNAWGRSAMLERLVPRFLTRDFEPGAALRLYTKDLALVRELGTELGVPMPLADAAAERLRVAVEAGLAEADCAAVVRPYEEEARVEVRAAEGDAGGGSV